MSERARPKPVWATAVVGVGNILMGDEGIGVKVVQALEREILPEGADAHADVGERPIELFDGGTAFQALTGELAGFDKLIIVDAVNGGKPPGTIYVFDLGQILEGKWESAGPPLSLHDIGVIEALRMERLLEGASGLAQDRSAIRRIPEEIVVVGIEPARIEPSMELSPTMEAKLPELVQTVLGELERT